MTTQTLRTFSELGEAIRSRAISAETKNPEASKLRPKPKGEQDFVDQHKIQITDHPVATKAQFDGDTKNVGDHEKAGDDTGGGEKSIEQGTSKLPQHGDGSAKQDTSKAATKRFGDLKIIRPIKEEDEEARDIDELSRKTLGSFVKKASDDQAKNTAHGFVRPGATDQGRRLGDPKFRAANAKAAKRKAGISVAVDKLSGSAKVNAAEDHIDDCGSDQLTEDVFAELQRIVKRKQNARVKFSNGRTEAVDTFTASALVNVHKKLNPKNQKAFEAKMNKDPNSFISAVDFALKQVK